jgi:hypothetical protein
VNPSSASASSAEDEEDEEEEDEEGKVASQAASAAATGRSAAVSSAWIVDSEARACVAVQAIHSDLGQHYPTDNQAVLRTA